jgi:hypothetical protein
MIVSNRSHYIKVIEPLLVAGYKFSGKDVLCLRGECQCLHKCDRSNKSLYAFEDDTTPNANKARDIILSQYPYPQWVRAECPNFLSIDGMGDKLNIMLTTSSNNHSYPIMDRLGLYLEPKG